MPGITRVKSGPSVSTVRPIPTPTSRGVVEQGDKALFDHRNKGIPDKKATTPTGGSSGVRVNGGGNVNGASV